MKIEPIILHIELENQSVATWLSMNRYIIFSELIRFSKKLIENDLDIVDAMLVSNQSDNIVFILRKENLNTTLKKCMEYFLDIEEYEKCAEIRDLYILIENLKNNETKDIEISKSNQRRLKSNR